MLHKLKCPRCGTRGQVEREHPNPKIRCPRCQTKYRAVSLEVLEEGTVPPPKPVRAAAPAKGSSRRTTRIASAALAPATRAAPAPPAAPADHAAPVSPSPRAASQASSTPRLRASDIRKYGRLGRPRRVDGPIAWVKRGVRDGLAAFPVLFVAILIAGLLSEASFLALGIGHFIVSPAMACGVWTVVLAIARGQGRRLDGLFSGFGVLAPAIVMGLIADVTVAALGCVIVSFFVSTLLESTLLYVFGGVALALLFVFLRLVFAFPLIVDRKLPIGAALSASFRMTAGLEYWSFLFAWAVVTAIVSAILVFGVIAAFGALGLVPGIAIAFLAWAAAASAFAVPFGHAYEGLVKKQPGDRSAPAAEVAST